MSKASKFWKRCGFVVFAFAIVGPIVAILEEHLISINCTGSPLCEYTREIGKFAVGLLAMLVLWVLMVRIQDKD